MIDYVNEMMIRISFVLVMTPRVRAHATVKNFHFEANPALD